MSIFLRPRPSPATLAYQKLRRRAAAHQQSSETAPEEDEKPSPQQRPPLAAAPAPVSPGQRDPAARWAQSLLQQPGPGTPSASALPQAAKRSTTPEEQQHTQDLPNGGIPSYTTKNQTNAMLMQGGGTVQAQPATPQRQQAPQAAATSTAPESTEYDPTMTAALAHAKAQVEAQQQREKREKQLTELEANGMKDHAQTLRKLDEEMAMRRADMEQRHPGGGAQYEAGMKELDKERSVREARVMEKVHAYKANDRMDNLRAARFVVSHEAKLPNDPNKSYEDRQTEWKSLMKKAGLNPENEEHVSAYWDARALKNLGGGRFARSDWDGSPLKKKGFGSAVLSDGSLHVAPEFIHNAKKYAAVVAASEASDEEKARVMAELPRLQLAYAQAMLPILKQAGSTRAAQWIPGIASFQKWQTQQPRQGSEAEQANEYLKDMNQRGGWSKGTDNVLRSLLAGFADMGTMTAGVVGLAGFKGASETAADWSKRSSDFMAPVAIEGGNSGTTSAILGHVARMAGPLAATLLVTRGLGGGLGTMSALSGAQTAGSQYAETYAQLREEGKTHAQAWKATAPYAVASGLVTAMLTAAGGRTGFEAGLGANAGAQAAAKEAAQGYWKNLLLSVPKHALADIPQELPDELFSQIMSAKATNPDADLGQVVDNFVKHSPELLGAILLMGGAGGAIQTHQQANTTSTDVQASPSGPTPSVERSLTRINNIMDRPPEQRGHPTTQADLAQAKTVVAEHVQKLEKQTGPLSEAQQRQLSAAHAALARLEPALPSNQHVSGGRPELPEGAKLLQSSEHWFIFEKGGKKWVRFYAPEARSPNNVVKGGTGSQTDETSALLNPEGRIYVEEGQHRLTGVAKEGKTNQNTVPGHPSWLEYEYHGETDAIGHPPDYNDQKPFKFNSDNPYTNLEGYD